MVQKNAEQKIKCVAIHCTKLKNGGIERVISLLLSEVLTALDIRFILITDNAVESEEYPLPPQIERFTLTKSSERAETLKKLLIEQKVGIYWEHSYFDRDLIFPVFSFCRDNAIKIVLHHHSVFSAAISSGSYPAGKLLDAYKMADVLLALSHTDEAFFRLLGIPAFYLPNPLSFDVAKADFNAQSSNILWLARMVDGKRPLHAVKIMQKVLQSCPDAIMTMVGDGDAAEVDKVKAFIAENNLGKSITLAGFHKEVQKYYKNAALNLMTTQFEGFPMTVLECKAYGVPIIHYDLPYLEALQPDTGTVSVPQEDIDAAADIIIKLLSDPERKELKELSLKARKNYEEFAAFDQSAAYKTVFDNLFNAPDFYRQQINSVSVDNSFMQRIVKTMIFHYDIGWKRIFDEGRCVKDAEITSGLTWRLGNLLLALPIKLYRLLKGYKDA